MGDPLTKLAEKYIVDKCPKYNHHYTPEYYKLLKDKNYKNVVEIGIGYPELMKRYTNENYQSGASLRMWQEFFNASVVGIDIRDIQLNEPNINTYVCDQSDKEALEDLFSRIPNPDIIIDDGSHLIEHQIFSFKVLWKYVQDIYIIEDINKNNFQRIYSLCQSFHNCRILQGYISPDENQGFIAFQKAYLD